MGSRGQIRDAAPSNKNCERDRKCRTHYGPRATASCTYDCYGKLGDLLGLVLGVGITAFVSASSWYLGHFVFDDSGAEGLVSVKSVFRSDVTCLTGLLMTGADSW